MRSVQCTSVQIVQGDSGRLQEDSRGDFLALLKTHRINGLLTVATRGNSLLVLSCTVVTLPVLESSVELCHNVCGDPQIS